MVPCIIVDDESRARNLLQIIIRDYCPELSVEALCADLPSGIKAIKKYKPALIFLDIEMPGHSGLELLDFFDEDEVDFDIIFTTAYNEYALQAFRFSAIDYLLKPIQHVQLVETVRRYLKKDHVKKAAQFKNLQQNLNTQLDWEDKRIVVPNGQSLHFLVPSEIVMIKGESSYSEIHLLNGTKMLASKNLKHFEELLAAIPSFFRCHKSYIVNTKQIVQYVKSNGGYLIMKNGLTASLSVEKIETFLAMMK